MTIDWMDYEAIAALMFGSLDDECFEMAASLADMNVHALICDAVFVVEMALHKASNERL